MAFSKERERAEQRRRTENDVAPAADGSEDVVVGHLARKVHVRIDATQHVRARARADSDGVHSGDVARRRVRYLDYNPISVSDRSPKSQDGKRRDMEMPRTL